MDWRYRRAGRCGTGGGRRPVGLADDRCATRVTGTYHIDEEVSGRPARVVAGCSLDCRTWRLPSPNGVRCCGTAERARAARPVRTAASPLDHIGSVRSADPWTKVRSWSRARRMRFWMSRARSQVAGAARMSSSERSSFRRLVLIVEGAAVVMVRARGATAWAMQGPTACRRPVGLADDRCATRVTGPSRYDIDEEVSGRRGGGAASWSGPWLMRRPNRSKRAFCRRS